MNFDYDYFLKEGLNSSRMYRKLTVNIDLT